MSVFAWTVWRMRSINMAHQKFLIRIRVRSLPVPFGLLYYRNTVVKLVWMVVADNIFVERLWRSVKYEDIYPKNHVVVAELLLGLAEYFIFYNSERFHQALSYKTPNEVYKKG